jgi:hypothetical protein
MKSNLVFTSVFGFGAGYDYRKKEISIHLFIWCLEIRF